MKSTSTPTLIRSCSLEVTAKDLDPLKVSLKIGTEADRSFKCGDISPHDRSRFQGLWNIESDRHVSSGKVDDHIAYIVDFVTQRKENILDVKKEMQASVWVRVLWEFEEKTINFAIDQSSLRAFSDVIDGIYVAIT
jgi:Domain of unknown function (DUF4279)